MLPRISLNLRFALAVAAVACGSYLGDPQPDTSEHEDDLPHPTVMPDEYEEVDEPDAETVLVVVIYLPGQMQADVYRLPVRRDKRDRSKMGVSRVVGHRRIACGPMRGYYCSVRLSPFTHVAGMVTVSASVDWTGPNNLCGEFHKDIHVPWLGEMKQDVGSGASVRCYFVRPAL
jgi:hypothetical protein